jgi:flagellar biosynthetic protein FliR
MSHADLVTALPAWAFAFVLVLSRIASACMLIPALGEAELPAMVRAGFATAVTFLLLPVVMPQLPAPPTDLLAGLVLVMAEAVTGLWLGWLARLAMLALPMAAQIAASMVGLANILQPDAALGPQSTALARLFSLAAPMLILSSGLHALPLAALAGSYAVLKPGNPLSGGDAAEAVLIAVAESFAIALRLAAPFVLASIVWNVALGLLTRLVPQLQIFFTAMPGQILGGFILLSLLAGTVTAAWSDAARDMLARLPGL